MSPTQIAGVVLVISALAGFRLLAARRIGAGQGRFAWIYFLPTLAIAGVWLLQSLGQVTRNPVLGLVELIPSVIFAVFIARAASRVARITPNSRADGSLDAIVSATTGDIVAVLGVVLIGGVLAAAGLIVFGILQLAS
jgi:hypothetical protein